MEALRCLLLAGLLSLGLVATPLTDTNSPWLVRVWQSDDGLPNNNVTGLAQTPDGYLWVATYSRPARFDGVRFEEYSPKEFAGGDEQKISSLQLNRDGGLWMGTLHGAVILLNSQSVRIFPADAAAKQTLTMIEDGEGALWVTYQAGGVSRIKDGRVTSFTAQEGLPQAGTPDRYVCSLARDSLGRIWFAKNGHVGIFRQERFETLLQIRPITTRLLSARQGGLWVCSGKQLWKLDEGQPLVDRGTYRPAQDTTEPTALLEDREGSLWIGTTDSGLFRYDGASFESVPTSDQRISCLMEDAKGNLWVGTASGGLNQVSRRVIALETTEQGLPFGTVQSLCENTDGVIWAAVQNGQVLCRQDNRWQPLPTVAAGPAWRANCVTADEAGTIWIGTRDRVLQAWRNGQLTSYRRNDGLAGRETHTLLASKKGGIWIGETSPDIVQRWRDGRFETFTMPPNIRGIRAMVEDPRGDLWLGTSRGMLLRISEGVVHDETSRTTGEPLSIRCLHAAPDGGVWIGYADEGVGWFKAGRYFHLSAQQGFPENNISQIAADDQGWLWFGSDHGIFKVRQHALEKFAAHGAPPPHYIRYGRSEGLLSLEATCGNAPGVLRSRDGRLWMPMRTALAVVSPRQRQDDPEPPPVLLKRVTVDDRTVAAYGGVMLVREGIDLHQPQRELRLPPGHHRLEFEFTALSFRAPENVRFRYRLEGFDDRWTEATVQRSASYSRLATGDYQFRVQACNSDGVWNEQGATVVFSVAPFLWQTWWLRLTALAIFTAGTTALVRFVSLRRVRLKLRRLEQQAALAKERARIARDLHDEFGTRLTELGLIAELELKHSADRASADRSGAALVENIRALERDLDTIVWAVNPKNDSLDHLARFLCRFVGEFLGRSAIRCRFDVPDELPALPLTPELRHHLFLVVREAVNNVAKHSGATVAKLRLALPDGRLQFRLEDDGHGFAVAAAEAGERNGLKNMRSRIAELGGVFHVQSAPGQGSVVEFTVPLQPRFPG
jgi:signal transduction histidine kinase/ligand-binding sensor domain-containing protein